MNKVSLALLVYSAIVFVVLGIAQWWHHRVTKPLRDSLRRMEDRADTLIQALDAMSPVRDTPATPSEPVPAGESSPAPVGGPPVLIKPVALLITGCSDGMMWYAGLINQKVPYLGQWSGEGYKSREPDGYINIVLFKDAKIVEA